MPSFSGQLRANEIFATLFNMIISQEVFGDNIAGTYGSLMEKSRVDGGLYGDTKLFYSTDVLKSRAWGGDTEATNLLQVNRPKDPETQAIVLDVFRQIDLTVDEYLTKRAWIGEGAFAKFNSIMLGMIRETKRVYDSTLFNAYVGTAVSAATKGSIVVSPTYGTDTSSSDLEGKARIQASAIAKNLADLIVNLKDVSRDYNDYKHMRSYNMEDIIFVWNSAWVNQIEKFDLPTIFHKKDLLDKFAEEVLPQRYFGVVLTSSNIATYSDSTPTTGKPIDSDDGAYTPGVGNANGKVNSMVEKEITVGGVDYHVFPGEEIPSGATVKANGDFELDEVYIEDAKIVCKVMHKRSVPFMSAFEASTAFFNARSLTTNHYLTWGHNTLEYLKNYPFIQIKMN